MDSRNGLPPYPPSNLCCDTPPTQPDLCCCHHCWPPTFSLPETPVMIPRPFDIPPNGALMSEECTDQCVVITCHDPEHNDGISCGSLYGDTPTTGGASALHPSSNKTAIYSNCTSSCPPASVCLGQSSSPCLSPCSSAQMLPPQGQGCGIECNPVYSNLDECADCVPNYFYDFLKYQCCTDPYSAPSSGRMSSISPHDLDATAVGSDSGLFWNQTPSLCSRCGQERSMCSNNGLTPPYPGSTSHPHTSFGHPSSYAHNSSQVAGEGLITCHWGNCRATFSSPAELVGHVNLHHLYIPSMHSMQIDNEQSPSTLSLLPIDGASIDPSNLSCQWQNCGKHPEPKSSHTCALSYEQWRDFIAVHVFKDHLGLPADIVSAEGTTENKFLQGDGTREPPASTESMGTDLDILSTPSLSPTLSSMTESVDPIPRISLHTPIQESDDRTASSASESSPSHRCRWHECTASFSTCEELTVHLSKVHVGSGRPIYECLWKGCSRNGEAGFGSRQKINRHLQSHTGHRPFQCNICHQNFSEAATLQQHMRRHTREKPYVCDHPDCGKAFAIAGALTIHKRTHNGQRPFKCPHCDRTFAESSNLSKHLRTHTGVKPYTCREVGCSKSFARPDQLSRHLLTHKRRARPPDNL